MKYLRLASIIGSIWIISAIAFFAYRAGQNQTQNEWDIWRLQSEQTQKENLEAALKNQLNLMQEVERFRGVTAREKSILDNRIRDLTERLRNRPSRPVDTMPQAPSADTDPKGCTGAELYSEDGAFLIRESERADTLRGLLIECRNSYESMRTSE